MNQRIIAAFILMASICIFCGSTCAAAEWVPFFQNDPSSDLQFELYYDKDSMTRTEKGTVLIWYKNVPLEHSRIKPWIESLELREVDCQMRRYQTLQGHWMFTDKPLKEKKRSPLTYFNPSELDTAYYTAACKTDP